MSYPGESSVDERMRAVEAEYNARQLRLFTLFATVEGALLLAAVLIFYVFELADPAIGNLVVIGIAVLGGLTLTTLLMRLIQSKKVALARARGENPLF